MCSKMSRKSIKSDGFTLIELLCVVSILLIFMTSVLKIHDVSQERSKLAQTRAEMLKISEYLEDYRIAYGDYPRIISHNDTQGEILCSALHGKINPMGETLTSQPDFVDTSINEINGKFVDPFLSDYIYYYKTRSSDTWLHPSFVLISKGTKGQQGAKRNKSVSKSVSVSQTGEVSGNLNGDIVLTSEGFL